MNAQRSAQLVEAGLWLQMSGDVEGARRLFEQALKLDPSNARARELLQINRGSTTASAASAGHSPERGGGRGQVIELSRHGHSSESSVPVPAPAPSPPMIQPIIFAPDATSAWDSKSNPGVHLNAVKPGLGDVMDMLAAGRAAAAGSPAPDRNAASDRVREEVQTLLGGARDLLELDDHSGAMDLILKAQVLAPNDPEVQQLRERSERTLEAMFESKLGAMTARPKVILKQDEIIWLNLDHRAGFVLAQIDGSVSFEDLFEVCGMSRLDTARILAQLVDEGVITV